MYGELIGVWDRSWREIWSKLSRDPSAPPDLFSELYPELAEALALKPDAQLLAERSNDPFRARAAFMRTRARHLSGEPALVRFLEDAHEVLEDYGSSEEGVASKYFALMAAFIDRYSLRYDLRPPFKLCPTLPGVFIGLIRELRAAVEGNPDLERALSDLEHSMRDLTIDRSEVRIKTSIQKQMNFLEALGQFHPDVSTNTLGGISEQLHTWPHAALKEAIKKFYHFACDYPGIRHAGTPAHALRDIEMRDLIAISILTAGFTPYLTDNLDAERAYWGGS